MEEKQEIMAQVITDLEMKNTQLEDQLNQSEVCFSIHTDRVALELRFVKLNTILAFQ